MSVLIVGDHDRLAIRTVKNGESREEHETFRQRHEKPGFREHIACHSSGRAGESKVDRT